MENFETRKENRTTKHYPLWRDCPGTGRGSKNPVYVHLPFFLSKRRNHINKVARHPETISRNTCSLCFVVQWFVTLPKCTSDFVFFYIRKNMCSPWLEIFGKFAHTTNSHDLHLPVVGNHLSFCMTCMCPSSGVTQALLKACIAAKKLSATVTS